LAGADTSGHEGWTLLDYEEDYRGKVSAYKSALKRHSQSAFDLVLPYFQEFCDCAGELADQMETNEKSLCSVFRLPYRPSGVQLLVRKCMQVVSERTHFKNTGNPPRRIADIIC